ncbi:MAG: MGMT family protein [Clostridiales bacterium]|nr:MGMT family protein [Clostridiales bacterium]
MNTFEKIYEIVKQIPRGKVCTYGTVAVMAGDPGLSRVVGYALHSNPDNSLIPCHRVVNRFGEVSSAFAFGGANAQTLMLEAEGIVFDENGRVDLKKYLWSGE